MTDLHVYACVCEQHVQSHYSWRLGLVVTALHTSTKLPYVEPGWYWDG